MCPNSHGSQHITANINRQKRSRESRFVMLWEYNEDDNDEHDNKSNANIFIPYLFYLQTPYQQRGSCESLVQEMFRTANVDSVTKNNLPPQIP